MARKRQRTLQQTLPEGYATWLQQLKSRIRTVQVKAALSVNRELISLYWEIGKSIVAQQRTAGWGDAVLERLGDDLRHEFPEMAGFSRSNLFSMRLFYLAYKGARTKVQQVVGQIPWGHNLVLLSKLKTNSDRVWYARQTIENGWSRAVLIHQIETGLHQRKLATKSNNFHKTLPAPQSELVEQTLKDSYVFDFLQLRRDAKERDLQRALLERLKDFLLELGAGFALFGSEFKLEVDGKEYRVDLLFFHHRLRCLLAIDLKTRDFEPEFAGKMNFYLSALDTQLRHKDDQPSVGLILCKGKSRTVVEYALRDFNKPIGVAEYRLTTHLPKPLAKALPAPEKLKHLLSEKVNGLA